MKLIGLAAIFMCMTMTGITFGNRLRERASQLQSVIKLLYEIETMISYQALSIYEIFKIAFENKNYEKLKFIEYFVLNYNKNEPFFMAFSNAAEKSIPEMVLKSEDIKQLLAFATGLGTTDVDGQIKNCKFYIKLFEESLCSANKIVSQKQKLYYSLGIFAGLFATVLFI